MAADGSATLPAGRRWLVRGLLALATVVAIAAIFAVWANRQVLDAENWSETSSELLANDAIRTQVAAYLVDQLYEQVDVQAEVAAALPARLEPLAGPAANGLRQLAERRTERLLGRPLVQRAWEEANRLTAQQFIDIAEGDSRAVTLAGNAVVLNLREVLRDLVTRLGGPGRLVNRIPDDAARVTIMTADEVGTLQNAFNAVKGMSAFLPGLSVALFVLAVFLAPGRRRRTIAFAGGGFVFAGAVVLVGRGITGDAVVDALAGTEAGHAPAEAVWSIGTEMLRDVAQAAIVMGLPVVAAAWLAGPTRPAVALRRTAAPWLRTRPDLAYAAVAALILLVVAWGPIPATRMVLPVLLFTLLAVSGVAVLRRQIAEEFPEATTTRLRLPTVDGVKRAVRTTTTPLRPRGGPAITRLDELERLAALHDRGVLSDDEFAAEKRLVVAGHPEEVM